MSLGGLMRVCVRGNFRHEDFEPIGIVFGGLALPGNAIGAAAGWNGKWMTGMRLKSQVRFSSRIRTWGSIGVGSSILTRNGRFNPAVSPEAKTVIFGAGEGTDVTQLAFPSPLLALLEFDGMAQVGPNPLEPPIDFESGEYPPHILPGPQRSLHD